MIVYFLALLAVALAAVSWFVYDTSSRTLRAKEASTRKVLEALYRAEGENLKNNLDKTVLRRAQTLAGLARNTRPNYETLYPLGALGAALQPGGHMQVPLWLAEAYYSPLAFRLHWSTPMETRIKSVADLMKDQPQDFFQTFDADGTPMERSPSLEKNWVLNGAQEKADGMVGYYDTIELRPGVQVRRVTLKTKVTAFQRSFLPQVWHFNPKLMMFNPVKGPMRGPFKPPMLYIQYGTVTAPLETALQDLRKRQEDELARQADEARQALAGLRTRFWWIGALTFVGIVAGGYWLVRLGLSPLQRLSEAVSLVSEKDFRLQIEEENLPRELRPIVHRLTETLQQLRRAFDREKQAAADISHELRTPLAALLANLDVALRKQRTPEEYQEILEECRASGQQMTQLVERLLALARLDAGADTLRACEVDVAALAWQCADMVRPLAEARGLELRVHAPDPLTLKADPDKLREILANLLHNAVEYNRPEGSIDLAVERDNGHLCLEVRDTGIGIPPNARTQIFQRFYRADPSRHADTLHAGIGLAIVKGYVDLMGGTIGVDSDNRGSTFRVQFPVR
jgi:heavy metal sensor kinase